MSMCQEFESHLMALARGEWIASEAQEATLSHIESCPLCPQKLRMEQMLTAGLAALKDIDKDQVRVPDHLENTLLLEFRKATTPFPIQKQRKRKPNRRIFFAFAAAMILVTVLAGWFRERLTPPKIMQSSKAAVGYSHPVRVAGSEFVVLPYAPSLEPDENAEIYRVRVPRATLTGMGLPAGGRPDEALEADLVVGPDGVARAIRVIR